MEDQESQERFCRRLSLGRTVETGRSDGSGRDSREYARGIGHQLRRLPERGTPMVKRTAIRVGEAWRAEARRGAVMDARPAASPLDDCLESPETRISV
jgi:hypothetical protein